MSARILRSFAYIAAAAVLLAVIVAVMANFNIQPVRAGGSPQPLYQLLSDEITAKATFTIYTQTKIATIDTYIVHSLPVAGSTDYFVSRLGTDYICIQRLAKGSAPTLLPPLCIPYSAIAGINYY